VSTKAITGTSDPVVFEPVLNVPALVIFLLITTVFGALIIRTSEVQGAVQERNQALSVLRELKSKELSGGVNELDVPEALSSYEKAVLKVESIRNIIPGVVRIVPPSSAEPAEEDARMAAKQFLGQDFDIGSSNRERESGELPTFAAAVLVVIFLLQFALIVFMNVDPVASSSIVAEF
jgi:hypothetical protein